VGDLFTRLRNSKRLYIAMGTSFSKSKQDLCSMYVIRGVCATYIQYIAHFPFLNFKKPVKLFFSLCTQRAEDFSRTITLTPSFSKTGFLGVKFVCSIYTVSLYVMHYSLTLKTPLFDRGFSRGELDQLEEKGRGGGVSHVCEGWLFDREDM